MIYRVKKIGARWALIGISLVEDDMGENKIMFFDSAEAAAIECEKRNNGLLRG